MTITLKRCLEQRPIDVTTLIENVRKLSKESDLSVHTNFIRLLYIRSSIMFRCMMTFIYCVCASFIKLFVDVLNSKVTHVLFM